MGSRKAVDQFLDWCLGWILICVGEISLVGGVDGVIMCDGRSISCLGFCGMGIRGVVMDG